MSDLPSYDYNDKDEKKKDEIKLTAENAESIMNFINNM